MAWLRRWVVQGPESRKEETDEAERRWLCCSVFRFEQRSGGIDCRSGSIKTVA